MIDRPDWPAAEPPEPAPQRPQSIPRPDWDGSEAGPEPEPEALPVEMSKPATSPIERPDWDGEPEPDEEPESLEPESLEPQLDESLESRHLKAISNSEDHDLDSAREAVDSILSDMPAQADFESGFNELPGEVHNAVLGELALTDRENAPYANVEEVNLFSTTPEGKQLVELWGTDADIHLGILQARLSRMENNTDMSEAWDWYDSLTSEQAKTVIQVLAE